MPKLIMSIAIAFLLGITIAGCSQVSDLRTQLVQQTKDLQHKPSGVWDSVADRGE